jgi:hypothetical protein
MSNRSERVSVLADQDKLGLFDSLLSEFVLLDAPSEARKAKAEMPMEYFAAMYPEYSNSSFYLSRLLQSVQQLVLDAENEAPLTLSARSRHFAMLAKNNSSGFSQEGKIASKNLCVLLASQDSYRNDKEGLETYYNFLVSDGLWAHHVEVAKNTDNLKQFLDEHEKLMVLKYNSASILDIFRYMTGLARCFINAEVGNRWLLALSLQRQLKLLSAILEGQEKMILDQMADLLEADNKRLEEFDREEAQKSSVVGKRSAINWA